MQNGVRVQHVVPSRYILDASSSKNMASADLTTESQQPQHADHFISLKRTRITDGCIALHFLLPPSLFLHGLEAHYNRRSCGRRSHFLRRIPHHHNFQVFPGQCFYYLRGNKIRHFDNAASQGTIGPSQRPPFHPIRASAIRWQRHVQTHLRRHQRYLIPTPSNRPPLTRPT